MINHSLKCIFIQIPKTGSMSVGVMLRSKHIIGDWKDFTHNLKIYSKYRLKYYSFFTFCFVRNPWARFASNYFYFKRGGRINDQDDIHTKNIIENYKTFEDFVNNFYEFKHICKVSHFRNQTEWVDTLPPNFIGRVESFNEDLSKIFDILNLRLPNNILHRNSNGRSDYKSLYNKKTVERVAELYSNDVDRFDYTFDI